MKRSILIILLSIFAIQNLCSQQYTSLVKSGATWINFFSEEYPLTQYRAYRIEGDTMINSIIYSKMFLYKLGYDVSDQLAFGDKSLYAFLREDTISKQVFQLGYIDNWGEVEYEDCSDLSNSTEEFLLYDFSLSIGDTLGNCQLDEYEHNSTIVKDTIELVYGELRRILYNQNSLKLIEGIGYEDGIYMNAHTWVHAGWGYGLKNFCLDSNINCQLISRTNDLAALKINIYPNPTPSHSYVRASETISNIEVIHPSGKIELKLKNPNELINAISLADGIYIIKIIIENDVYFKKIIKAGI